MENHRQTWPCDALGPCWLCAPLYLFMFCKKKWKNNNNKKTKKKKTTTTKKTTTNKQTTTTKKKKTKTKKNKKKQYNEHGLCLLQDTTSNGFIRYKIYMLPRKKYKHTSSFLLYYMDKKKGNKKKKQKQKKTKKKRIQMKTVSTVIVCYTIPEAIKLFFYAQWSRAWNFLYK